MKKTYFLLLTFLLMSCSSTNTFNYSNNSTEVYDPEYKGFATSNHYIQLITTDVQSLISMNNNLQKVKSEAYQLYLAGRISSNEHLNAGFNLNVSIKNKRSEIIYKINNYAYKLFQFTNENEDSTFFQIIRPTNFIHKDPIQYKLRGSNFTNIIYLDPISDMIFVYSGKLSDDYEFGFVNDGLIFDFQKIGIDDFNLEL